MSVIERLEARAYLAVDLAYSSFFGGNLSDQAGAGSVVLDNGDVVVSGATSSTNLTTTAGGISDFGGGDVDVFVARFDKTGKLKWATYLGGNGTESDSNGLNFDTNGDIVVSGDTTSSDFPTTAGLDRTLGGDSDGYVTRLNPNTGKIIWSTYVGGSGDETDFMAQRDPNGGSTWFFSGVTASQNFPVANGFDNSYGGGDTDGVVGIIGKNGKIVSASYVGGSGNEDFPGMLEYDPAGNMFKTFRTTSRNIPVAGGGFRSPDVGGADAYLLKIDTQGDRVWSSLIGGSADEGFTQAVSDNKGGAILFGSTASDDFPATPGQDRTYGGGEQFGLGGDAFLLHLNGNGKRQWATYVGGNGFDSVNQILIDEDRLVVAGRIGSTDLAASGGFDNANSGDEDTIILNYSFDGELDWSTYVGGAGGTLFSLSRLNPDGSIYVVGTTNDENFSAVGGFDTTFAGGDPFNETDAYVVKVGPNGNRLWSTFVGGTGSETFPAFDFVESNHGFDRDEIPDDIVLVVPTTSDDAPTKGAFDNSFNSTPGQFATPNDALVLRLSPNGALDASSYLGGKGNEFLSVRRADANGDVLLVGTTASDNYPTTSDASDKTYNGPLPEEFDTHNDVVITRVSFGPRSASGGGPGADPFATLANGRLTVAGTGGNDEITVRLRNGNYEVTLGDETEDFDAGDVEEIRVNGKGGSDTIKLNGAVSGATVNGGAGADTLTGGTRGDRLLGKGGNDRLVGRGGADNLLGGKGKDTLLGGAGADTLNGQAGADDLNGGKGKDTEVDAAIVAAAAPTVRFGLRPISPLLFCNASDDADALDEHDPLDRSV